MSNSGADVWPDFGPNLVRASSNHPIALYADSRQVGVVAENVSSGPQAIHIAKREVSMTPTTARRVEGHRTGEPSGVESQSRARVNARTSPGPARRSTPEPETMVLRSFIVHTARAGSHRIAAVQQDRLAGSGAEPSIAFKKSINRPSCSQAQPVSPPEPHTPNVRLGLTSGVAGPTFECRYDLIFRI